MSELWRFLKDGENNNNEFDIYSIMKSKIMRDYYRDNIKLSLEAKMLIIINSYISFDEQRKKLLELNNFSKGNETLMQMIELYNEFYEILKNPNDYFSSLKLLYILKKTKFMCNNYTEIGNEENYTFWMKEYVDEYDDICLFDTLDEVLSYINEGYINEENNYYIKIYYLDVNNKTKFGAELQVRFITNKFEIHRIYINKNLLSESLIYIYRIYDNNRNKRFYMPYNNGDTVSIKLPGIDRQFTGILQKEFDGAEWYSFLEGYNKDNDYKISLDISCNCINSLSIYSIFDFII